MKANNNQTKNNGRKKIGKKFVVTPLLFAIICAVIVCLVCIPLFIALNANAKPIFDNRIISGKELGYNLVMPEEKTLAINKPAEGSETTDDDIRFSKGSSSEKIKEIQLRLMELGYMPEIEPTELFGPATEEAVKLFQLRHGLNKDGIIDKELYSAIFSENAQTFNLKDGSNGADVSLVQSYLSKLGYFTGASTGYYGSETEAACK